MARVYLETSYVSACVTDRTDAASSFRRRISLEWWQTQSGHHSLFTSLETISELQAPGFRRGAAALQLIAAVPLLEVDEEVAGVALALVNDRVMPGPVAGDAVHVAVACVHDVEYLLSWNVRHLANPRKLRHLQTVCRRLGLLPPTILTPDQLWEQKP